MPDRLTPEQRSAVMSRIRSTDTGIEVAVRSALHKRGLRFRKHVRGLAGRPDVVFSSARVAVFIDGDFWHGYQLSRWKDKLQPYWLDKIERNRSRDRRNFAKLRRSGWRVIRVWEHEIERDLDDVVDRIAIAVEH